MQASPILVSVENEKKVRPKLRVALPSLSQLKRKGKVGERKGGEGGGVGKEVKLCKNREERKAKKSCFPFSLTIENRLINKLAFLRMIR